MIQKSDKKIAYYHLPGLFEFYDFYEVFLPLYRNHREYFYEWCDIGSIYGAPADCIWGGGRAGFGDNDPEAVAELMKEYGISARLTFSNSLLGKEHLSDKRCNELCELFNDSYIRTDRESETADMEVRNGVIIYSDLLMEYLKTYYPKLYFVSSTTKVLTDFDELISELNREDFSYVVPDFRHNKEFNSFNSLSNEQKSKIELLCNECCYFGCNDRKACYEAVSRMCIGEDGAEHICQSPYASIGYRFSLAMENPGFVSIDLIKNIYMPMEIFNFKIEGRSLGSALLLEFILYYMTKPEYHIHVREALYLDNTLDLF